MPGFQQDFDSDGFDDQDTAEALDETMLDDQEERSELRTFEELPELFDDTRRVGDADDDEAREVDAADFDPDRDFDADELERDDESLEFLSADDTDLADEQSGFDEDRIDEDGVIDGLDEVADANLVSGGEDDFTNFQSKGVSDADLKRMGYSDASGLARRDG
jgi:hypothetical protein